MTQDGGLSRDRVRLMGGFIENALRVSRARMRSLGIRDDALLDPEESIDQQVAVLRALYLEAEKSALPFDPRDANFWRVLRARLQPVVLAYLTHEKFVQTLDLQAQELRPDALQEVYRERLDNSTRFRDFFFELNEKLRQEGAQVVQQATAAVPVSPVPPVRENASRVAEDTASIQGNVLKMLERQLRDLEKDFSKQGESLRKASEEILSLKDLLHERNADLIRLEKKKRQLEEENSLLKLSMDAAVRSGKDSTGALAQAQKSLQANELLQRQGLHLDADREQLLLKIDAMEQDLATTSDAAYNAFMSSSDLGIVILFMLTSFKCHGADQLAQEMARSVATFGVKVVAGFRVGAEFRYLAAGGADVGLQALLELHRNKGMLVEAQHLLMYETGCCLLVQDPPKADSDRYERLKDNLGTLLRAAQTRFESIDAALAVQRQKNQVEQLILRSHDVFQTFDKNMAKQQGKIARIINLFAQDLRKGLSIPAGDQKSIRLNMELKKMEDSLNGLFRAAELIDPAFVKNINRVAQGIQTKQKGSDA